MQNLQMKVVQQTDEKSGSSNHHQVGQGHVRPIGTQCLQALGPPTSRDP